MTEGGRRVVQLNVRRQPRDGCHVRFGRSFLYDGSRHICR